jgi:hypothetical protein
VELGGGKGGELPGAAVPERCDGGWVVVRAADLSLRGEQRRRAREEERLRLRLRLREGFLLSGGPTCRCALRLRASDA